MRVQWVGILKVWWSQAHTSVWKCRSPTQLLFKCSVCDGLYQGPEYDTNEYTELWRMKSYSGSIEKHYYGLGNVQHMASLNFFEPFWFETLQILMQFKSVLLFNNFPSIRKLLILMEKYKQMTEITIRLIFHL